MELSEINLLVFNKVFKKTTVPIHFNLPHVCPSVPSFIFAVLFIPSFNFLSGYFYVSLSLVVAGTY